MINVEKCCEAIKEEILCRQITVSEQYLASPYYDRWIDEFRHQNQIVIVGAGFYAMRLLEMLRLEGLREKVSTICDNNKAKHGTMINGIGVISIEEAAEMYADAYYIITPKQYENELLRQLTGLHIPVKHIAIWTFAYTGLVD